MRACVCVCTCSRFFKFCCCWVFLLLFVVVVVVVVVVMQLLLLSCSLRPVKTEETVSHHQNNRCKGGGDLTSAKQLVYSAPSLLFQQLCGTQSHRQCPKEPAVETRSKGQSNSLMRTQLHLPVSSVSITSHAQACDAQRVAHGSGAADSS